MMQKKTLILVNLILFLSILVIGFFFLRPHFKKLKANIITEEVSLDALKWNNIPSFITARVWNTELNTAELDIYRATDAKSQNLEGNWNFLYTQQNEIFVYGTFSKKTESQHLFILNDKFASSKDISKLPGPITNIRQNPKGTYLLITGIEKNSTSTQDYYTCVGEKLTPGPYPCRNVLGDIIKDYDKTLLYQSFWNLENPRELITLEKGGQNRMWSFDPWEDKPLLVTNTAEKTIQTEKENPLSSYTIQFYAGGRIVSLKTKGERHSWFFVKKGSEIKWLNETHFLLIEPDKKIFIYDMETRQRAFLVDLPDDAKSITTYYNPQE